MIRYFFKKLLSTSAWFVGSIFVLLTITFFASEFNPVDPVLSVIGENASQEVYKKECKNLGLDKPMYLRFGRYIKRCVSGDFGKSVLTGMSVSQDLLRVFPVTLDVATLALFLGILISLPLGVVCAFYGGALDRWISSIAFVGHSAPNFLIGYTILMFSLLFAGGGGSHDTTVLSALLFGEFSKALDALWSIWPPVMTLAFLSSSYIVRMMRGFTLDEKAENYFITAKIKGLSSVYIFFKHLLPNIWPRLIPVLAFSYTSMLEGSIVTEMVFALPGQGSYLVRAVLNHDDPAIMGSTIVIGASIFLVNIIADLAVLLSQPFVRARERKVS